MQRPYTQCAIGSVGWGLTCCCLEWLERLSLPYIQEGIVESCWITDSRSQEPWTASGPQTAVIKSVISWSKKVLFQFVAGFVLVQSGGVSSGTTRRGLGHHGAKRT